jgi:NAD(P)-dependent dehydrogenase (short-subunit alcohol dehydrogenase family)
METMGVVTGASSGIGYELAAYAAGKGYDLIVAAEEPGIEKAAEALRARAPGSWRQARSARVSVRSANVWGFEPHPAAFGRHPLPQEVESEINNRRHHH